MIINKILILILISLCFKVKIINGVGLSYEGHENIDLQQKWKLMMERINEITKNNVLDKRFQIEKNLMELNLTRKCMISIKKSFDGVMNLEDWAVQSEYETN